MFPSTDALKQRWLSIHNNYTPVSKMYPVFYDLKKLQPILIILAHSMLKGP